MFLQKCTSENFTLVTSWNKIFINICRNKKLYIVFCHNTHDINYLLSVILTLCQLHSTFENKILYELQKTFSSQYQNKIKMG